MTPQGDHSYSSTEFLLLERRLLLSGKIVPDIGETAKHINERIYTIEKELRAAGHAVEPAALVSDSDKGTNGVNDYSADHKGTGFRRTPRPRHASVGDGKIISRPEAHY